MAITINALAQDYQGITEKGYVNKIYRKASVMLFVLLMLTIPPMLLINYLNYNGWNLTFLFAGMMLWLFFAFIPRHLLYAMAIGFGASELADTDRSQGALAAIGIYTKKVMSILMWYMWLCLVMVFVSFRASPGSFFAGLALILFITVVSITYNIDTRKSVIRWAYICLFVAFALVAYTVLTGKVYTVNSIVQSATTYASTFSTSDSAKVTESSALESTWATPSCGSAPTLLVKNEWSQEMILPPSCFADLQRRVGSNSIIAVKLNGQQVVKWRPDHKIPFGSVTHLDRLAFKVLSGDPVIVTVALN